MVNDKSKKSVWQNTAKISNDSSDCFLKPSQNIKKKGLALVVFL